ncbi:high nitrogen upregulated cytochrome P450 monooxygenase 2 [Marasmius fiardii PR-910]|nr:high nitrogen upregulated cytochrome P450 monooxygenase 2 [Marasmius fiardii PR-910]
MDPTVANVIAGITTYFIFKRTETIASINLFILLLILPGSLPFVTAQKGLGSGVIQTTLGFLGYYATIIACTILYRLSPWHPLAAYPGPLICKLTKLKGAAVGRSGKQYLYYQELHRKYGDVVRIGPNELSFLPVEAIDPIMGRDGIPKGPFWDGRIPETQKIYALPAIRDLDEHRRRRIPWSKAFTTNALKEYEVLVKAKTDLFIERLSSTGQNGKNDVEIGKWLRYYTYDLMTDFVFSGGSNMLHEGDPEGLWDEIRDGLVRAMYGSHVPWLGRISYRLPARFFRGLHAFRNNSIRRAMKRKEEGSERKDLYYYLLDEGNPHAKSTVPQAIADASAAVLAGSDTTSMTLAMVIYYLLSHPKIYERLKQEIDTAEDDWNDTSVQAKMGYLNAVINETLRLWPAALNGSARGIKAHSPGKIILDRYIPPGTNVNIPFYSVHRDPRNFAPFPEEFIPERWLDENERLKHEPEIFKNAEDYTHNTDAFLAFSAGPANCVGRNLAMMEMRIVVCTLMKKFEMEFVKEEMEGRFEETVLDYYTMHVGELWIRLRDKSA